MLFISTHAPERERQKEMLILVGTYSSIESGREIWSSTNSETEISECINEILNAFKKNDITVETAGAILDEVKNRVNDLCSQAKISYLI